MIKLLIDEVLNIVCEDSSEIKTMLYDRFAVFSMIVDTETLSITVQKCTLESVNMNYLMYILTQFALEPIRIEYIGLGGDGCIPTFSVVKI